MSNERNSEYEAERKFIHDISTPLSIAMGHIQLMGRKLSRGESVEPENSEQIDIILESLDKIRNLLVSRREAIIDIQTREDSDASPSE